MLSIGNKKYRNLQEQVGYNTEEIEKIKDLIDGIVIDDKLVVIDSASGSLSEAQMEVLDGPLAFISYNEKVYLKTSESATELVFKAIDIKAEEIGSAYFNIGGSKVIITIATKVYTVSDDLIIVSYSKSQIDSIVANINALKANLSGANFTGAITSPSIIEDMSGYSYHGYNYDFVHTLTYVSAVKNGNKLTLVVFGTLTLTETTSKYGNVGYFSIPADVASKIYPFTVGVEGDLVDSKFIKLTDASGNYADQQVVGNVAKDSHQLWFKLRMINVPAGTYLFRHEVTFLLNDSLI